MSYLKPAIVVAAYNRERSLSRLLSMLLVAEYPEGEVVPLVISIDGGGAEEVVRAANDFEWPFGDKKVIAHSKNLGLRQHILRCGDLTARYGAIIMLEDDLGLSRFFYEYTLQALNKFSDEEEIAGISLYKHLINVNCGSRFEPMDNGLGYYYMQFAQSWGQIWTREQWSGFRQWYDVEKNRTKKLDIPKFVANWPESSWLKYYISYLVDQKKYFVYPMRSLTTNFSDAGTHVNVSNNMFQVPLAECLPSILALKGREVLRYDAYFEMEGHSYAVLALGSLANGLVSDLYGIRDLSVYAPEQKILTIRPSGRVYASYGLYFKPRELNVLYAASGSQIFLTEVQDIEGVFAPESRGYYDYVYEGMFRGWRSLASIVLGLIKTRIFRR